MLNNKTLKVSTLACIAIAFAISTLIFFPGCKKKGEPEVYKIGAILPLTGAAKMIGEWTREGIMLGIEHINDKGGVLGKKIEVIFEDNKTSPREALNALNKLISLDNINVFISAQNAIAASIVPVADKNNVVGFFIVANLPGLPDMSEWVFRYHVHADVEAEIMAQYAFSHLGFRKIALFYINDEYGISSGKSFRNSFEQMGGGIIYEETFEKDGIDFRAEIMRLKETTPQAIYIVGYERALAIAVKQIRETGLKSLILSNNGFTVPAYLELMGGAAEGAYCTAPSYALHSDYPLAQSFIKSYKTKFGKFPNFMAAEGYDSVVLLAEAINRSGGFSSEAVKKGLLQIKDFDVAMGRITILPNGEVDLPTEIGIVKGLNLVSME